MIDLLLGGSPCQGFSKTVSNNLNFEHPESRLFFEYAKALKILKPRYFLLENVSMEKWCQDVISEYVGVEPIIINSNLVSAQDRERLYWTNIIRKFKRGIKGVSGVGALLRECERGEIYDL